MRARRSTFKTSCNTSLKLSTPAIVSASRGGRRSSTSMDTTLAARLASSLVSTPMPGPISSTPQFLSTPLASTIFGGRPGLMMKFCPKPLESAKSYFSHRVRITERSVSSGIMFFLSLYQDALSTLEAAASEEASPSPAASEEAAAESAARSASFTPPTVVVPVSCCAQLTARWIWGSVSRV